MRISSFSWVLAVSVFARHVESAPSAPIMLTAQPFTRVELATSNTPFTKGKVRTIRTLRTVGTIDDFYFDAPRRVAIGTATGWKLVDPMVDRVIADIPKPGERLSANELVVKRPGELESTVALDTGAITSPVPKLPIAAPLQSMYIIHAKEGGGDVFLMATAAGRTFVGLWNDRAAAPTLDHEIDTPPGWAAHRRRDGLELWIPTGVKCKGLRLHRGRPPECMNPPYDESKTQITGTWEVDLHERSNGRHQLVAHDQATGREEILELSCPYGSLSGSTMSPRVLVTCTPKAGASDRTIAATWTPGRAHVLRDWTGDSAGGHHHIGRVIAFAGMYESGEYLLDVEGGAILQCPTLKDLNTDTASRTVAVAGKGAATKVMVVDAAAKTVRLVAATPCAGEILVDEVTSRYTAFSCGIADRPGKFEFARVWSKIVDTDTSKIYDLPGYADAVFADGTVILSNRTRLTAETRGPNAKLTLGVLE